MEKPEYHVASFSGGKDSTAMVLHMIERGDHLDEVVFCDTTMEFPAMIRHVEKVKQVIEAAGIKFTTLRAKHDFEYYLLEHKVERKPGDRLHGVLGYGWAGHASRWCTSTMKREVINRHFRELREQYRVVQYIGLAADEGYRLARATNQNKDHRHPLVEWGWTEADAIAYCRSRGYDWEGLYDIFNRVSCWCCPLKSHEELRKLRKHFPDLWAHLLDLDSRQGKPFNKSTVANFDRRFALEDALIEAGQSIKNRAFHTDLKRLLAGEASTEDIIKERIDKP